MIWNKKKELEEIEDKWKQESLKLIDMVNKLKEDNRRLNDSLAQQNSSSSKQNDQLGLYFLIPLNYFNWIIHLILYFFSSHTQL